MKILEKYFPLEVWEHQWLASVCADRHSSFRKDEDAEIGEDAVTSPSRHSRVRSRTCVGRCCCELRHDLACCHRVIGSSGVVG